MSTCAPTQPECPTLKRTRVLAGAEARQRLKSHLPGDSLAPKMLAVLAGNVVLAAPSYAYLDPGTGSVILQSLLAGIAVAVGVLRLYWYRLKAFFRGFAGPRGDNAQRDSGSSSSNLEPAAKDPP